MFSLVARALRVGPALPKASQVRTGTKHAKCVVTKGKKWARGYAAAAGGSGVGAVIKLEGRAALLKKLEDPVFRKDFIANPPYPEGRDIWNDNPRLHISLPEDPLPYTWPMGRDFASYDPLLSRTWEDELFAMKWAGKAREQIQGGDWANYRISTGVPPRIKIYYAQIVSSFQDGRLISATKAFNALLTDYFAPRGSIPYGVYHTMLLIYKKRERFDRALDMFNEIVSHHTPTADDYGLGMEVLLALNAPAEALEVWNALKLRPSIKANAFVYSMLIRTHAALGHIERAVDVYNHIERDSQAVLKSEQRAELTLPIFTTLMEVYAELGYQAELKQLVEGINSSSSGLVTLVGALQALNTVKLHAEAIKYYNLWFPKKDRLPVDAFNAALRAYIGLKDATGVQNILNDLNAAGLVPDVNTYAAVIAARHTFADHAAIVKVAKDGLAMKDVRPSVRNFRTIHTANVVANATVDANAVSATLAELDAKDIEMDTPLFEALNQHFLYTDNYNGALDMWEEEVLNNKLTPKREAFSALFEMAGKHRDLTVLLSFYRLAQFISLRPDLRFTASLALAIQPDRNHFGTTQIRAQHRLWTENPTSTRVLDHQQLTEFNSFIDHIYTTLSESQIQEIDAAWATMKTALLTEAQQVQTSEDTSSWTPSGPVSPSAPSASSRGPSIAVPSPLKEGEIDDEEGDNLRAAAAAAAKPAAEAEPVVAEAAEPAEAAAEAPSTEEAAKS